jgi:SprT protein
MEEEKVKKLLQQHVPIAAAEYCFDLWKTYRFVFKTKKARQSKVGDFTFRPGQRQQITINHDLHPYLFLTTYIHEVAHLIVHGQHGRKAEAHGQEWKTEFKKLLEPLLSEEVYPRPLLTLLRKHMVNPKASSYSDSKLTAAFRSYDVLKAKVMVLSQLPEGSIFRLQKRWFKKGETKRTRVLCLEVKTRRQYLVPADAEVGSAQLALL